MRIGITERGDAGLDLSWIYRLHEIDGAILITKNANEAFRNAVLTSPKPIIVHATCTGWGGTYMEPAVPFYKQQLDNICKLINAGFPKNRIVLRIDPIIAYEDGFERFKMVLDEATALGLIPGVRVRVSFCDNYPHVKDRLLDIGKEPFYNGRFNVDQSSVWDVQIELMNRDLVVETCAEPAYACEQFKQVGCVSETDLAIMGLAGTQTGVNPQNRHGCLCLNCKYELLNNKARCPHGCLYCYWKG